MTASLTMTADQTQLNLVASGKSPSCHPNVTVQCMPSIIHGVRACVRASATHSTAVVHNARPGNFMLKRQGGSQARRRKMHEARAILDHRLPPPPCLALLGTQVQVAKGGQAKCSSLLALLRPWDWIVSSSHHTATTTSMSRSWPVTSRSSRRSDIILVKEEIHVRM